MRLWCLCSSHGPPLPPLLRGGCSTAGDGENSRSAPSAGAYITWRAPSLVIRRPRARSNPLSPDRQGRSSRVWTGCNGDCRSRESRCYCRSRSTENRYTAGDDYYVFKACLDFDQFSACMIRFAGDYFIKHCTCHFGRDTIVHEEYRPIQRFRHGQGGVGKFAQLFTSAGN